MESCASGLCAGRWHFGSGFRLHSSAAAVPAGLSTLKTLEPGRAYWIKTTRATVLAPAAAPTGTALYYHPDHLGSTAFTTDKDGKVTSETHYYPFGLPRLRTDTDASGAEYLHTDHELDSESGLIYSNARYRDPVIGRFVSVDPLFVERPDKCGIQECNLYSYTANNPINRTDPTGSFTPELRKGQDNFRAERGQAPMSDREYAAWQYNASGTVSGNTISPVEAASLAKLGYAAAKAAGKAAFYGIKSLAKNASKSKGLITPKKYFSGKTKPQIERVLQKKFGPPKGKGSHNKSYHNSNSKRTYNVHQSPSHRNGRPHVDIRKRVTY